MQFVSIGECMVEISPANVSAEFRMGFAGDTFNTAWYMRALRPDWTTHFVSRVGRDATSASMLEFIHQSGIDTTHIATDDTRICGLYLIALADGERTFTYWRDGSAARLLADDRAFLETALTTADMIYLSGITLAIIGAAGRKTLLEVLAAQRKQGKAVAFDPNLRPALWSGRDEMCDAIMQAAGVSDLVLPSYEDEDVHFADGSQQQTCHRYLDAGATSVIVKNGPGPILFHIGGDSGTFEPEPVAVCVDTTAAGDSFNAGFLSSHGEAIAASDRIARAAAVSAAVIQGRGALVPLDKDAFPIL